MNHGKDPKGTSPPAFWYDLCDDGLYSGLVWKKA